MIVTMPTAEQWQAMADAIEAVEPNEEHWRAIDPKVARLIETARAVLDAHDDEEMLSSPESLGPAQ